MSADVPLALRSCRRRGQGSGPAPPLSFASRHAAHRQCRRSRRGRRTLVQDRKGASKTHAMWPMSPRLTRRRFDAVVAASDSAYRRASAGREQWRSPRPAADFQPLVYRLFPAACVGHGVTRHAPKWAGMEVGKVTAPYDARRRSFPRQALAAAFQRRRAGLFRRQPDSSAVSASTAREGDTSIRPRRSRDCAPGRGSSTRNADKAFFDVPRRCRRFRTRTIAVDVTLRPVDGERIALEALDERGCRAEVVERSPEQKRPPTPQQGAAAAQHGQDGGTIYCAARPRRPSRATVSVAGVVPTRARRELLRSSIPVAAST